MKLYKTFYTYHDKGYAPLVLVSIERKTPRKHKPKFYIQPTDVLNNGFSLTHTKFNKQDFTIRYTCIWDFEKYTEYDLLAWYSEGEELGRIGHLEGGF